MLAKNDLDKVLEIIAELTPISENNKRVTKADFRNVLLMVTTLCQFLYDGYSVTDQIVNENNQIRNVNQDLRFNEQFTRTCNDMEKSQRTVKVSDVGIDNSFSKGLIENMSSLPETKRYHLV